MELIFVDEKPVIKFSAIVGDVKIDPQDGCWYLWLS